MPTHPSMAVRCRALLWFDMFMASNDSHGGVSAEKLDRIVEKDLELFCEQPMRQAIQSHKDDYLLWYAAHLAVEDGRLDKQEQAALKVLLNEVDARAGHLPEYTYGKLMNHVTGMAASEVLSFVDERLRDARSVLIEKTGDRYGQERQAVESHVDACFREHREQK